MASYVGKIKSGSDTLLVGSTLYGTCDTAAATAAKVVTLSTFDTLLTGVTIHVKFTNSNTVANPTLNVNSTGAKSIMRYGTTAPGTSTGASWNAGAVVSFTYDGTYWQMNDWVNTDSNTTYTFANGTNGFTVTPAGGSAQTVTVTPSITNNVTGSGTSGYIAKFNGANTITNGPAFGSSTTTFLRNDGSWTTPPSGSSVTIGNTGTASASAVNYQRVGIDGSYTTVRGTMYMESSTKTTASGVDTFTFTNTNITSSAAYDFYADKFGVSPTSVAVSGTTLTIKFKSTDSVTSCRVYIK